MYFALFSYLMLARKLIVWWKNAKFEACEVRKSGVYFS